MTQVAETNRARFVDRHPTAARVGRFFGRRIPSAVTGTASAISFFALSSAAAPVSGILVATAVVMLITETVSQPILTHFRNRSLRDHLKANIIEIKGLKDQIKGLQAQLDEQKRAIGKATLENLAAREGVVIRLENKIPSLTKMGELLGQAVESLGKTVESLSSVIASSQRLMKEGVAWPRMKRLQGEVEEVQKEAERMKNKELEEAKVLSAHQQAIAEEIKDIETTIEHIKTGNKQGLEYLNRAHYIYVRDLGQGGMGKAQLYYYAPRDAFVVIKTILPEYQQDLDLIERFRREATIAKEMNHPNIARGFGYGGDEFVEEEFSNGSSVEALCKQIDADRFEWLPLAPNNTVDKLNELLRLPDFFDTCWAVKKVDVRLSVECNRLIDKTKLYRSKAYVDLTEIERSNIIRLNRILLEAGYQEACPRSRLYLITEFIRGKSLEDLLYVRVPDPDNPGEKKTIGVREKLSPVWIARMALRLIDAQAYTDSKGIIHRDLKPENVMIDADGNPKEIDFGLAREVGDTDKMTQTKAALGTQVYMSPEQLHGERDLTGEVDKYAIAEIIFEAYARRPLFAFNNPVDLISAKSSDEWVQEEVRANEDIPESLKEILIRMLLIEKENRPSHAEIYAAFQSYLAAQERAAVS